MCTDTLYVKALEVSAREPVPVKSARPLRRVMPDRPVVCRAVPRYRAHIERLPVVSCTAGFKLCVFDNGARDQSTPVREQVFGPEWEAWHALMQFEFSANPLGEVL